MHSQVKYVNFLALVRWRT